MKTARQQTIVQLLTRYDTLTTAALATQLNVSIETIRRDLNALQTQGKIVRRHGRARMLHSPQQESSEPFRSRLKSHYADKADIARHALNWIDTGMTLALDASSTCFHLARQLPDIDLTVFTNSVPVCQEIVRRQNITLVCSGGKLDRAERCYVNPALPGLLKSLEIDLFIFSCEGVDAAGEMWDSTRHNAAFKAHLLRRAQQSLLLIDKSKFYRASEVKIGNLSLVTQMITDVKTDTPHR
ncbi:transcriptional regulator, DeoR family [Kosakonia oryzendophytica]|uniref:Transcriptional regulator, DeoR family n=1 Tax=Kosakonia oryzendophytica TaxID=1005665 RepID=A0A1C4DTU6_9ENTR|nr:L-fucose operon activator [Kosakonia oryzendophytica]WBT58925.1 L-fucose operon activator [Kosakonia oryzendophytica]SCC34712.1 transcriptional regulator, DeoR family [Kosakonia oryzendophytica]